MKKMKVFDYGAIQKAVVRDDGSIVAYVRVAKADQLMMYLNRDGSTRLEVPLKADLYGQASKDSLRFKPVVLGHTEEEDPNPSNFREVASGMVGDRIFVEEADGFLGATMVLSEKDAVAAYHAGINQVSPGYYRTPIKIKDGVYSQLNRRYFELAYVPEGRGGADIKIKDSADLIDSMWADPAQFNQDWHEHWTAASVHDLAIQKLLDHGELDPPPVLLHLDNTPSKKNTMTKIQIGKYNLDVAETDVAEATHLARDWAEAQSQITDLKKTTDAAAAQAGEAAGLKAKIQLLETENAAKDSAAVTNLQAMLQDAAQCYKDVEMLRTVGTINLDAAEVALNKMDIPGYKEAVVDQAMPDQKVAKDNVSHYYKGFVTALESVGDARYGLQTGTPMKMGLPPELTQNVPAATQVSYADLIGGTNGTRSRGYSSKSTSGWHKFAVNK
jgi:Uncharacterized protein conserved in bacteria (DUF2213)